MEAEINGSVHMQLADYRKQYPDKRKVLDDEDLVCAKRLCHPTESSKDKDTSPFQTLSYRRKSEDGLNGLEKIESDPSPVMQGVEDKNNKSLEKSFFNQNPEEIEKLRKSLEDGNLEIRHFNCIFWKTLNDAHGTSVGYVLGFLLFIWRNHWWMWEEFADWTEGHSVGKTLVILFVIFGYSFINLGLELVQCAYLVAKIYFPNFCLQLKEEWCDHYEFIMSHEKLKQIWNSKYFYAFLATLCCMISALVGSEVWLWFWWNHTCKTYHDKTCRASWVGQLVIRYRDDACYDGTASSAICEKFVSYLPIMLFAVTFTCLGNVILPIINDWLSVYYPISPKLEAAFDIMQSLNQSSNVDADGNEEKEKLSFNGDFTFKKTFEFDGVADATKLSSDDHAKSFEVEN